MRLPNFALLCLLLSACPPQDHVVPDPSPEDDGDMEDPTDDGETGREACETAGGSWEQCPPNADCTYYCNLPEGQDDDGTPEDGDDVSDGDDQPEPRCLDNGSRESCDAAGCTWDRCAPTADCDYQCWGEFECEAGGGTWKECPPNADCVHEFWCSLSERQTELGCGDHTEQPSCEAAGCAWDALCGPADDCSHSCVGPSECEAVGGTWRECPPNADCVRSVWCEWPAPGSFACGPDERCVSGEFCEVVASDIPEFETGYNRYACRPIPAGGPACDDADYCACVEQHAFCSVYDIEVSGTCSEPQPGAYTLTCGIGG